MRSSVWVLYVTPKEFSDIARLADSCVIRNDVPGHDDGFDDERWVNGLSDMGLTPPEDVLRADVQVVLDPPATRYAHKSTLRDQHWKLTVEL